MRVILVCCGCLFCCLLAVSPPRQQGAPQPDLETLIDRLVDTSELGYGYSALFAGSEFLPYEESGEVGTMVLFSGPPTRSEVLRELVQRGVAAVPSLLKHIDDDRHTKIPPVSGMMWMDFSDEYDFNRRTRPHAPEGVNRDSFDFLKQRNQPKEHAITVGDLCFVALGQIVNRTYSATRYQPSGGMVVSSPTHSKALRKVIVEDWRGLTRESHKQLLIEDFLKPDHESRRIGAYRRLSLYYPDAVEDLVVRELSKPTFDVFVVEEFCRDRLYLIEKPEDRQRTYEAFIRTHGPAFATGVRNQLFDDLEFGDHSGRARELLVQIFKYSPQVKAEDRPPLDVVSQTERSRLIGSLIHDDSLKVGDVVRTLFTQYPNDVYFSSACLRSLASRGYGAFLLEQLNKINPAEREPNELHAGFLAAISASQSAAVREKLFEMVKSSANEAYFMAALPAVDRSQDRVVLEAARRLLAALPRDTKDGGQLLQMIDQRFPDQTKAICREFLSADSANRGETVCVVLWYGHPLAKEILTPLLEDKRELEGFTKRMRVCDRASEAIRNASPE